VAVRLIIVGLGLLSLLYWVLLPQKLEARQSFRRWTIRLALVGAVLLLLRLGLPWLAMAGTAALALLRIAAPTLVRLLPLWLLKRSHVGSPQASTAGHADDRYRPTDMTRNRALEVLNLPQGASREEILRAHRELIKRVHPDRGGSSYLAAEVNRARDVLVSDRAR
jgi:DnaJ homolog subfamily C member 19